MGIDFVAEPISRAKKKAAEQRGSATFLVVDALALKDYPEVFDIVIDSGLFHVFSDEDRRRYVEGLATVLKPGGRLFLLCFSDEEPGRRGRGGCRRRRPEGVVRGGAEKARLNDQLCTGRVCRIFQRILSDFRQKHGFSASQVIASIAFGKAICVKVCGMTLGIPPSPLAGWPM